MKQINASIITIGDELLIGQTIDTNSAFIAQELNKIGVWVRRRLAVGDVYEDIWNALEEEGKQSDIIIITGGLGPTADDITKPLLCKYFGGKLVVNEKVLEHVKYLFEKVYRRPGPILEVNLKQAEVPDVCEVLFNKRGTAPGMMFRKRVEASPNPSEGGASVNQSNEKLFHYMVAEPGFYPKLKKFVKENRSNPTEAENKLWSILKGKKIGGYKFRRQHIIDRFIADFVCIPKKLVIEVDGLIHQLPENNFSDTERTRVLNHLGFRVVRFSNDQVLLKTDEVINNVLFALNNEIIELSNAENPPLEGREANMPKKNSRGAFYFSLPGVPHEMKGLMLDEVIPRLLHEFQMPAIVHKTAFTAGQGESMLANMLKDFEPALPENIKLAYLPNYGMVRLRLTVRADNKEEAEKEVTPYFQQLQEIVKDYLVSNEDEGLEAVVGKILKERNMTMGTAESCTGGYIAHLITTIPGSSVYFKGSIVSYANEIKEKVLGVREETIMQHGAVSEETVIEMVQGALKQLNTDYAVAVSGIMGPDGGTAEKPVGTVWIAAGNKEKTATLKLNLRFDRKRNTEMTAMNALNFLRKFILSEP